MATVVLVHGAKYGSWSWQRLTPFLRAAGHEVSTPSLTGLGERVHLAHPGIDLDTHVTDIVNHLFYEDLTDVTLVGWSYGGTVITGVAGRVPERLRQLIYLDAIVPEDGQSLFDADDYSAAERAAEWAKGEAAGMPGFEPPATDWLFERLPPEANPGWIAARVTPHPLATLAQPVRVEHPGAAALPRAYVFCTADKAWDDGMLFYQTLGRIKADPAWRFREVDAAHIGPLTTPDIVAPALLELIGDEPAVAAVQTAGIAESPP